jgi:hypothetical protein
MQELKQLVAGLQPVQPAEHPVMAASGLASGANWRWGVAVMGGLIVGAALMVVSTIHRRRMD